MKYLVDWQYADEVGALREIGKTDLKSHHPLSGDYEKIGVMGELAFSQFSGYPIPMVEPGTQGDRGVDFEISGYTIDVKTSPKAWHLIVQKPLCDIYVLAKVKGAEVELLGWATKEDVEYAPLDSGEKFKPGKKFNIKAHYIDYRALRPMFDLQALLTITRD